MQISTKRLQEAKLAENAGGESESANAGVRDHPGKLATRQIAHADEYTAFPPAVPLDPLKTSPWYAEMLLVRALDV